MIWPLCPALFLAAAKSLLPYDDPRRAPQMAIDEELDGSTRDNHRPADPMTSAAFVGHVGYWSHHTKDAGSWWPFPRGADCSMLADLARRWDVLRDGKPWPGTILLRWSVLETKFVRASIVLSAKEKKTAGWGKVYRCEVIEGAVGDPAAQTSSGDAARRAWRTERLCCPKLNDRFIAWVDLDHRFEPVRRRPAA